MFLNLSNKAYSLIGEQAGQSVCSSQTMELPP